MDHLNHSLVKYLLVAALASALTLAACGGGGSEAGVETGNPERFVEVTTTTSTMPSYPPADADLFERIGDYPFVLPTPDDGRLYSPGGGIDITGLEQVDVIELGGRQLGPAEGHELWVIEWVTDDSLVDELGRESEGGQPEFTLEIDGRRTRITDATADATTDFSAPAGVGDRSRYVISLPEDATSAALVMSSEGIVSKWSIVDGERIEGHPALYVENPTVRIGDTYNLEADVTCASQSRRMVVGGVFDAVALASFRDNSPAPDDQAVMVLFTEPSKTVDPRPVLGGCGSSLLWDRSVVIEVDGEQYTQQVPGGWAVPADTTEATVRFKPVYRFGSTPPVDIQTGNEFAFTVNFQTGAITII